MCRPCHQHPTSIDTATPTNERRGDSTEDPSRQAASRWCLTRARRSTNTATQLRRQRAHDGAVARLPIPGPLSTGPLGGRAHPVASTGLRRSGLPGSFSGHLVNGCARPPTRRSNGRRDRDPRRCRVQLSSTALAIRNGRIPLAGLSDIIPFLTRAKSAKCSARWSSSAMSKLFTVRFPPVRHIFADRGYQGALWRSPSAPGPPSWKWPASPRSTRLRDAPPPLGGRAHLSGLLRPRRLIRDYERLPASYEALVKMGDGRQPSRGPHPAPNPGQPSAPNDRFKPSPNAPLDGLGRYGGESCSQRPQRSRPLRDQLRWTAAAAASVGLAGAVGGEHEEGDQHEVHDDGGAAVGDEGQRDAGQRDRPRDAADDNEHLEGQYRCQPRGKQR